MHPSINSYITRLYFPLFYMSLDQIISLMVKMSTIFLFYSTIIIGINGILCQKAKKGGDTLIDYSPLWETMKKRHISQYALINKGIDKHTLDQLRKNQNITILTVEKLCNILNCTPNDVFAFKDEKDL